MTYLKDQKHKFSYPVLTMGTFDGLHKGHQKLLAELKKRAQLSHGEAVVVTYYHHPLETIHRKTFPYLLTERDKKEELLKKYGADYVLYLEFDEEMANLEPREFFEKVILAEINPKEMVVGYDTHFGKNRKGDFNFLKNNESRYHYQADLIEPIKIDGVIVSSSRIRDFVREGDMQKVETFLGRKYSISGIVKTGHRIGRTLGFPTINVEPHDSYKLIPALGVYVCQVLVEGKLFGGITNIGYSPTLKESGIKEVETHLLDFDGDLYDKKVEVFFVQRLRDEEKFESKDQLITAIKDDVVKSREILDRIN